MSKSCGLDSDLFLLPDEKVAEESLQAIVRVTVVSGSKAGTSISFLQKDNIVLGSQSKADVCLPDPGVAAEQLIIARRDRGYVLLTPGNAVPFLNLDNGKTVHPGTLLPSRAQIATCAHGPVVLIEIGLAVPFGTYQLIGKLGGGGMAEVFLARQRGLGGFSKNVAIKLINHNIFDINNAESMFLDEARIAAELNHNNIVRTYEVGMKSNNLFISMEYLRGVSLYDVYAELAQRGLRLPPALAAALISQACAGLHALHELQDPDGRPMNVVHRDVSHSNMMLTPDGVLKVIDLGLARDCNRLELTDPKILKGKPSYMSPEQVQSQPLDRRTDIWALGVMLYELCTGQSLFTKDDMIATLFAVARSPIPPLSQCCPNVSRRLEAVVAKALSRDLDTRYAQALQMGADLRQVVADEGGQFLSHDAIVGYLASVGVNLTSKKPALLTYVPEALGPSRTRNTGVRPNFSYVDDPSALCHRIVLSGTYKLATALGPALPVGSSLFQLQFHAQVVSLASASLPSETTKPSLNKPILAQLIGQGKQLQSPSPEQHEALGKYVKHRQEMSELHGDSRLPFATIHEHGVAWDNGPTIIVLPAYPAVWNIDEICTQPISERLHSILQLGRLLQKACEIEPGYVHGCLRPENISILPGTKHQPSLLLGFSAAAVLRLPLTDNGQDPFLAPECRGGAVPGQKSDIYSFGAIAFALLDGDLSRLRGSRPPDEALPRLPPNRDRPAYVEPTILSALDPNPEERPSITELLSRLQPPPLPPPPPHAHSPRQKSLRPPTPGTLLPLRSAQRDELRLCSLDLSLSQTRAAIPLTVPTSINLFPAPLVLLSKGSSISLELADPQTSRDAPQLYLNAHEPGTKLRSCLIAHSTKDACVDLGHRRTWVQRIHYYSQVSEGGEEPLKLHIPDLDIEVESRGPALRLIVFRTTDNTTGCIYLICISIRM
jgi:serine/threonine protein kinase